MNTNDTFKEKAPRRNRTFSKSQVYEEILDGSPRKKARFSEPKTIDEYEEHLRGPRQNRFGGRRTTKILGLKGNTYGAASPCRTLSAEERAKVQEDLRTRKII